MGWANLLLIWAISPISSILMSWCESVIPLSRCWVREVHTARHSRDWTFNKRFCFQRKFSETTHSKVSMGSWGKFSMKQKRQLKPCNLGGEQSINRKWNAIDRANGNTLRRFKMPFTFGAKWGVNLISFFTLRNRGIGAKGFAKIAVNAGISDSKRHVLKTPITLY